MDITIYSIPATKSNTPKITNKICPICSKSLRRGKWSRWNDGHAEHIENYWALFKRTLRGTYVTCDVDHLVRYLDEQTFRFNNRVMTDAERFNIVLGAVGGKRLTYNELIEKTTYKQLNFLKKVN